MTCVQQGVHGLPGLPAESVKTIDGGQHWEGVGDYKFDCELIEGVLPLRVDDQTGLGFRQPFVDMEVIPVESASSPKPPPQPDIEAAWLSADSNESGPEEAIAADADLDHGTTVAIVASSEDAAAGVEPAKLQVQAEKEQQQQQQQGVMGKGSRASAREVPAPVVEVGDDQMAPKEDAVGEPKPSHAKIVGAKQDSVEAPGQGGLLDESTLLDEAQRLMSERSGEL